MTTKKYGPWVYAENYALSYLKPDTYSSVDSLLQDIEVETCGDKLVVLEFTHGLVNKQLLLYNMCPNRSEIRCYRLRNKLIIQDDSIRLDKVYPIDSLKSLLYLHYNNCGELYYLSQHPRKATVFMHIDKGDIVLFNKTIRALTDAYDTAESGDMPLIVTVSKHHPVPPPPPS